MKLLLFTQIKRNLKLRQLTIFLLTLFCTFSILGNSTKKTTLSCLNLLSKFKTGFKPNPTSWSKLLDKIKNGRTQTNYKERYSKAIEGMVTLAQDKNDSQLFIMEHITTIDNFLANSDSKTVEAKEAIIRRTIDLVLTYDIQVSQAYNTSINEFYHPHMQDNKWIKMINKYARELALIAHSKQYYAEGVAYSYHLRATRSALKQLYSSNTPEREIIRLKVGLVLWLHDSMEDSNLTLADLYYLLGEELGTAIHGLTNIPRDPKYITKHDEPLLIKKQRKVESKINTIKSPISRLAKLFDRIANSEESRKNYILGTHNCFKKYVNEWESFHQILYIPGEADGAWEYLEHLLTSPVL